MSIAPGHPDYEILSAAPVEGRPCALLR